MTSEIDRGGVRRRRKFDKGEPSGFISYGREPDITHEDAHPFKDAPERVITRIPLGIPGPIGGCGCPCVFYNQEQWDMHKLAVPGCGRVLCDRCTSKSGNNGKCLLCKRSIA